MEKDNEHFQIKEGPWQGQTLHQLYSKAYTPWEWHKPIMQLANELEMICFSTPFDDTAVDFLEQLDVPAYKIASMDLTNHPLLEYVAKTGKPIQSFGENGRVDLTKGLRRSFDRSLISLTSPPVIWSRRCLPSMPRSRWRPPGRPKRCP